MLVAFGAIGFRLFNLQARDQPQLRSLAVGQRVQNIALPAERGSIFDRNGAELAMSVPQTTISADPRVIDDPIAFAATLAPVVGVDQATLVSRLSVPGSAFAYIVRKVDDEMVAKVKALELPGLSYTAESKRFYPSQTLAGPVLGFVGTDNTGLGGLESQYEDVLAGKPGEARVERDPQGNELPGTGTIVHAGRAWVRPRAHHRPDDPVEHRAGPHPAGRAGEREGRHRDRRRRAHRRHPRDGDRRRRRPATTRRSAHRTPSNNAPVTVSFEPGSTNKVVTMAGAIEEGLVTPDSVLDNVWHVDPWSATRSTRT